MLKKFLPFTLAFALCGLILTGCEEDPVSGDDPSMKAEIDGDSWEANDVTVQGDDFLVIDGSKSDGSRITLTIPASASVDSHDLPSSTGFAAVYYPNAQSIYSATSGEITITSISATEVVGKFEFTAENLAGTETADIDDGTFVADIN